MQTNRRAQHMRTFTNLLYDICTVLGLFREGENPAHKRKSTNFEMHQKFWDQRYNAISRIIDAEGVYSQEQRRIIYARYEHFYYMMNSYPVHSTLKSEFFAAIVCALLGLFFLL